MLRHGLTVAGLKEFIIGMVRQVLIVAEQQGSSKSNVQMEWDKLWAINKKHIDPVAPRHTALTKRGLVKVTVQGQSAAVAKDVALHPKTDVGTKKVWCAGHILLEAEDANSIAEGETVTLMDWGNAVVKSLEKTAGQVSRILHPRSAVTLVTLLLPWLSQR
jgi:glutamyl/glutaminyl-tRNA synthetase